jgi:hypothetical protein
VTAVEHQINDMRAVVAEQPLKAWQDTGRRDRVFVPYNLPSLAGVAALTDRPTLAARWLGRPRRGAKPRAPP